MSFVLGFLVGVAATFVFAHYASRNDKKFNDFLDEYYNNSNTPE